MRRKQSVIPQDNIEQYQLWQAPSVKGSVTKKQTKATAPRQQSEAYKVAFALGLEEGNKQGYKDGMEKATAQMKEQVTTFTALLNSLAAPLKELDEKIENDMVRLTLLISRHLIRREIKTAPGEIVAVVREALSILPDSSKNPTIYLHPEDVDIVKKALLPSDEKSHWIIKKDRLLARGDCQVKTNSSYIDATIENRLSAIAAKMLSSERDSDDAA